MTEGDHDELYSLMHDDDPERLIHLFLVDEFILSGAKKEDWVEYMQLESVLGEHHNLSTNKVAKIDGKIVGYAAIDFDNEKYHNLSVWFSKSRSEGYKGLATSVIKNVLKTHIEKNPENKSKIHVAISTKNEHVIDLIKRRNDEIQDLGLELFEGDDKQSYLEACMNRVNVDTNDFVTLRFREDQEIIASNCLKRLELRNLWSVGSRGSPSRSN
jgi:hypothetical protein